MYLQVDLPILTLDRQSISDSIRGMRGSSDRYGNDWDELFADVYPADPPDFVRDMLLLLEATPEILNVRGLEGVLAHEPDGTRVERVFLKVLLPILEPGAGSRSLAISNTEPISIYDLLPASLEPPLDAALTVIEAIGHRIAVMLATLGTP